MTDNSIVRLLLKENFRDIYDALEESGGVLYLNNAINKWLLSLFIQGISEIYTLFIWDMLLLEGNIIIFKTIYALIIILEKHIIKCKTFDQLNNVFNEVPLKLNNRGKLAYYLISKKFNFNMNIINKYRKTLSSQIIKEILDLGPFNKDSNEEDEENDEENEKNKKIICDLDWPLCINNKKNLDKEYDHIVLKQLDEPNVIDNYFDDFEKFNIENNEKNLNNINYINDEKDEEQIKYYKEKKFKELLIERKKHYCNSKLMSVRSDLYKSSLKFEKIKSEEIKKRKISLKSNYNSNIDNVNNLNETNKTINRIVKDVSNHNQRLLSFVKEKVENGLVLEDDEKINGDINL